MLIFGFVYEHLCFLFYFGEEEITVIENGIIFCLVYAHAEIKVIF